MDSTEGDRYLGFRRCLKHESIIKLLQQMAKGKSIASSKTAEETYLFDDHPAILLEPFKPCLRDETEYYLIYTTLPKETDENQIVDGDNGIWEATITPHAITEQGRGIGKYQLFRYKPRHHTSTSWRMVMYSLDFGHESEYVICKVYEDVDSAAAKAARKAAKAEAEKIKLWKLLAAAEAELQTSNKMTEEFRVKLKKLQADVSEAEENATNLVGARNLIAQMELEELARMRAADNNQQA